MSTSLAASVVAANLKSSMVIIDSNAPVIEAIAENTDFFRPAGSNFWLILLVKSIEKIISTTMPPA